MGTAEKLFVFVSVAVAWEMLKLKKGISEISIVLTGYDEVNHVPCSLRTAFPWFSVVFIAIGFGILNTMLIAVFERRENLACSVHWV
nr:hypothetical protein [Desulfobacterales bacterium]